MKAVRASISEAFKRDFANAYPEIDQKALVQDEDRKYKEQIRQKMTSYYEDQKRSRPNLHAEHFLDLVHREMDNETDVVFITGMKENEPITKVAHLVPETKVIEVHVRVSERTRQIRRGVSDENAPQPLTYAPTFVFTDDTHSSNAATYFAMYFLCPLLEGDLQKGLPAIISRIPGFPRPQIDFRHVLGLAQRPGGLDTCTRLLAGRVSDWSKTSIIVTMEAGGFIFASPLAVRVNVPLALVRDEGKLPPPKVSVAKPVSNIKNGGDGAAVAGIIGMDRWAIPKPETARLVIVDDVLATGRTLGAVLGLLGKVGVMPERVSVLVVAEFPMHRGREYLVKNGFGMVNVQSLLVYGGL